MLCNFNLRSSTLPGSGGGGTWIQEGYNVLGPGNPFIGGGTTFPLGGDDPVIDPSGAVEGYYYFLYFDGCNPPQPTMVYIASHIEAGTDEVLTVCINDGVIDLLAAIGGDPGGTWSISLGSDPVTGGAFNAGAGEFTPSMLTTDGTFQFEYQTQVIPPSGFQDINCVSCNDIAKIRIKVLPEFDAGTDTEILISADNGQFNLYDFLDGSPDTSGTWVFVQGLSPITPTNGYLGTVNLDGAQGCAYIFLYSGGEGACYSEALMTVTIERNFEVNIVRDGDTLTAVFNEDCINPSFIWTYDDGTGPVDQTNDSDTQQVIGEGEYWVSVTCQECAAQADTYTVSESCANDPCFNILYDEGTDCVTVQNTGINNSPVISDVLQWKKGDGGTYANYTGPICGCDLFEFLDVVPYCLITSTRIRVGYSSFTACPGRTIGQVIVEYGDGTNTTHSGALSSFYVQWTPAEWIAKGRTALMRIRVTTPIGFLFKKVKFTYTGSGELLCSSVTITHENYPKLYYKIWAKRVVTYSDGCPTITCESFYQKDNGCIIEVYLTKANVSDPGPPFSGPAIVASTFNAGAVPTYTWYKDGVLLAGETLFYVPQSYGNGTYQVIVSALGCTATDTLILQTGCTNSVSINISGTNLVANVSGCSGGITYQWTYWNGSSWVNLGTASTQATTQGNGLYRVSIICSGCVAESQINYTPACNISVSIALIGSDLVATPTGCTGSPSYQWQIFSGGAWVNVGTNSNTYTPAGSGIHRVILTCNGCSDIDQYNYSPGCVANVTINVTGGPVNPTLTAVVTGCGANPITYLWEWWTGSSWANLGTGSSIVATNAGFNHRVTIDCGGCSDVAFYFYTGCNDSVVISITGGGTTLTATPSGCSGAVNYDWYISLNGGSTYTPLSPHTATITPIQSGLYKVILACDGCLSEDTQVFTLPCNPTLDLNWDGTTLTALTSGCSGVENIVWQYSSNYDPISGGCTGWFQVASGVYSYIPMLTGCYRVITTCDGTCLMEEMLYIEIDDPCTGLTLTITPSIGVVSWGNLKLNGVNVTNYLISWVDQGTMTEVFQSGAGSFFNPLNMYPHPSTNIPLPVGTYKAIILDSDVGEDLDCFPEFDVEAVECGNDFALTYNGPGGVAATQEISVAVDAGTGYIKIGFQTQLVADKIQVEYDGVIIFDSGNIVTNYNFVMFVVPITFVVGENYAKVIVTNSTPSQNTIFNLYINCCTPLTSCPITLNDPVITAGINPTTCVCAFNIDNTYDNFYPDLWNNLCQNVQNYQTIFYTQTGGCGYNYLPNGNYNCADAPTITNTKPSGQTGFILTFPPTATARYNSIKARIQGITNPKHFIELQFKSSACLGDGYVISLEFFPLSGILTFDDANRRITYIIDEANPFTPNCSNCDSVLYTKWNVINNYLSLPSAPVFGNFPAIIMDRTITSQSFPVQNIDYSEILQTDCGTVERRYRISYRDSDCPCESWQIHEDHDLNGSYTVLIQEASGWTGSCTS